MTATPFNQQTIDEFHARNGRGVGRWGDNLLLMTSKGARSGQDITTPVVNRREGDHFVIAASKGGMPDDPGWFRNIQKDPDVEIEVPVEGGTRTLKARARVVADRAERDRLYAYMTEIWPAFADYEAKTDRLIPVVVVEPLDAP